MFKKIAWTTLFVLIFEAACVAAFLWATAPSNFYAGQHDGQCEKLDGGKTCECYQRLVSADREFSTPKTKGNKSWR